VNGEGDSMKKKMKRGELGRKDDMLTLDPQILAHARQVKQEGGD